jgi:hypothetical protein
LQQRLVIGAAFVIILVLSASFVIAELSIGNSSKKIATSPNGPIYFGVTYSGDNVTEAKSLIDRVKNYTNLFVIQSGPLQKNKTQLNEICTYVVAAGLRIIVYFGSVPYNRQYVTDFLYNETWGSNLLGIYLDDEPGGRMLDSSNVNLLDTKTGYIVSRYPGSMTVIKPDGTHINYYSTGTVSVETLDNSIAYQPDVTIYLNVNSTSHIGTNYVIEPNGTVYLLDHNGNFANQVNDTSELPKIEPYNQILAERPLQNSDDFASSVVNTSQNTTSWLRTLTSVKVFTSDYALYWYDYLGGYDVVFAQLGGNRSGTQDIALVRGAANLQGKDWGAIITWKYDSSPYIENGSEMYSEILQAYEAGAKYIVVFNYSPNGNGTGLLADQHFSALQQFWTDTVQNKKVINGGTKAEAVLVLPKNYGGSLRGQPDNIWGMGLPDNRSMQVWAALQACMTKYGSKLDIVYDNSAYQVHVQYHYVYYWNQTI